MTVPPHDGPNDTFGTPPGYPAQQPNYPSAQPAGYGPPAAYGQPGTNPAGYGRPPQKRPGMVTAAAVLAFVTGGLGLVFGLVALGLFSQLSAFFGFVSVLVLVVAAVEIWGGLQVLNGRDARILTIAAAVGVLLNLISLVGAFEGRSLLSFVIPGLILYFLLNSQSKAWFDQVGAKHF